MKKINLLFVISFLIFIVYSLINIKETNLNTITILLTFSKKILPSLLPFLILNQIIIKLGIIDIVSYFFQYISYPLFKLSGKSASIIIISLLNGFPSSAIFTSLMVKNNEISKQEGQRIINNIFFPSLSFLFAIIYPLMSGNNFIFLIISIYLSAFTMLYISSFKIPEIDAPYISFKQTARVVKEKINNFNFTNDIKEAISYSFNTLTNILGIIIIFSIPCLIINNLFTNKYSYFLQGLIEFSIPSIKLLNTSINKKIITLFIGIIISFSGLSSLIQASLFINDASLNTKKFIINRILITLITFILLSIFLFSL